MSTADGEGTWPVRTEVVGLTDHGSIIRITAGPLLDVPTSAHVADLHPLGDLMPLVRTRAETPYTALDVDREELL